MENLTTQQQKEILQEEVELIEYDDIDKGWNFDFEKKIWFIPVELTFNPNYAKKLLIDIMIEDEVLK